MWLNKYITFVVIMIFVVNAFFFFHSFYRSPVAILTSKQPLPIFPPTITFKKFYTCNEYSIPSISAPISLVVAVHVSDSTRYAAVRKTWANCSHVPPNMRITFVFFTSISISFINLVVFLWIVCP
jgi:hypothetical protein